ncbi:hypothetical protein [Salininema proteolyticum]|uniref:Uncharacterized protein n=1 Tax=Salininema proteolyticum TaxID=1607685 RepID=A0ABV8TVY0_9ACTN
MTLKQLVGGVVIGLAHTGGTLVAQPAYAAPTAVDQSVGTQGKTQKCDAKYDAYKAAQARYNAAVFNDYPPSTIKRYKDAMHRAFAEYRRCLNS